MSLSFLNSFTTKPYKCTRVGKLFPNLITSTRPALHTSAFTMVFYEIAQAGPDRLYDKYVNSKLIYEPFSPLYSLVSASITKRKVSIAMRMHEKV